MQVWQIKTRRKVSFVKGQLDKGKYSAAEPVQSAATQTIEQLSEAILRHLDKVGKPVDSQQFAQIFHEDHQRIVGAIKSLQTAGEVSG